MIAPALRESKRLRIAKRRAAATLLGAALLAARQSSPIYGASVGYEFVYDDHVQIERNPWLRDPDGFRLFLTRPFWGFYSDRGAGPSNYYRPVFGWAYSLVARGFGLQPAAFHAVSVALHLAVTLLVALGARRLIADGGGSGGTSRRSPPACCSRSIRRTPRPSPGSAARPTS